MLTSKDIDIPDIEAHLLLTKSADLSAASLPMPRWPFLSASLCAILFFSLLNEHILRLGGIVYFLLCASFGGFASSTLYLLDIQRKQISILTKILLNK